MLAMGGSTRELRATLAALDEALFAALFHPLGGHTPVALPERTAKLLSSFGLIAARGGALVGQHRIRRQEDRFYVLDLGGAEYHQDVWPETDALLTELAAAPPGTLCDMATGCGVIAIEAAVRGHRVVATDLFAPTLRLARWNAELNGVAGIDFRRGHLFEPVRGERFALILTAPHYGRVYDQLRVETLTTGVQHLADGGRLVLATQLEWEQEGPPHVVPGLLAPLCAQQRLSARLSPIEAALKRGWFQRSILHSGAASVPSRARFLIELWRPGDGAVAVTMPAPAALPSRDIVPLSRLSALGRPGAHAAVDTSADATQLFNIVQQLQGGALALAGPLPAALYDGCRFGIDSCLDREGARGAAAAIIDVHGGVRPCARGDTVASVTDSLAEYVAALAARAQEAAARRGCVTCTAAAVCSRCLFPTPLDEGSYCDFVRAHVVGLGRLRQLAKLLAVLAAQDALGTTLRITAAPSPRLLFARERLSIAPAVPACPELTARWRDASAWIVGVDDRCYLARLSQQEQDLVLDAIDPFAAAIAELLLAGAPAEELVAYTTATPLPLPLLRRTLARLSRLT